TIDKLTADEFSNTNPNVAGGRGSASNLYRRGEGGGGRLAAPPNRPPPPAPLRRAPPPGRPPPPPGGRGGGAGRRAPPPPRRARQRNDAGRDSGFLALLLHLRQYSSRVRGDRQAQRSRHKTESHRTISTQWV